MTDNPRRPTQNQPEQYLSVLRSQPLTATDLHIWCASLEGSLDERSHFLSMLSPTEKARADRFYFERDRSRYIFGRGILRTLLGGYLGMEEHKINITYDQDGKPAVESSFRDKTLQFNLSHSNVWAVYIFGLDRLVGIDIEHIRPLQDADDFAERFYSPRERELINSLSGDKKWDAFYKLWTCKEAFLKAKGTGLTVPINHAEISLSADGSARLVFVAGHSKPAALWRIETFHPVLDYQAAIAVEGHNGKVLFRQLAEPAAKD